MTNQVLSGYSKDIAALGNRAGKKVSSLSHDRYFFNGQPDDEDMGSLEVVFSDSTVLTLSLASDGDSVKATTNALTITDAFNLNDGSRCSWEREVLTHNSPWSTLLGSRFPIWIFDFTHTISSSAGIGGWLFGCTT